MKTYQLFTKNVSVLIACICLSAGVALAQGSNATQKSSGLDGRWVGTTSWAGGDLQSLYVFKVDGHKLSGTVQNDQGTAAFDDGKVDGNTFSFKITTNGTDFLFKGRLVGDTCEVDIEFVAPPANTETMHTTLRRPVAKPPVVTTASELNGKWAGTFASPDGNKYPLTFTFKVDGGKLTGLSSFPQRDADIQDGKAGPVDFTFWINLGGVKANFVGKLHDHVCDLSWTVDGQDMATTLKKVPNK